MKVIEINENNFEEEVLKHDKVLVDFNATWCGPCRMLKPIIEEFSSDCKIKVCSCDVDDCENICANYMISSIPCLIIFDHGKEVKRHVGFLSLSELKDFVGE